MALFFLEAGVINLNSQDIFYLFYILFFILWIYVKDLSLHYKKGILKQLSICFVKHEQSSILCSPTFSKNMINKEREII